MDLWTIVLIIVGALVALWIVWKLFGVVLNVALSGTDRRFRASALGAAILEVGERSGFNDGSDSGRARAAAMFSDMLRHSPFAIDLDGMSHGEVVDGYRQIARRSSFPVAVEAAYAVTGAAGELEASQWSDPEDVRLASSFVALYPKWPGAHRTGSIEVARLERGRWAMMMVLLGDRAEREGLLPPA